MTLNKLYAKLRSYHWKNYTMLFMCIVLSTILVTSYALIYYSPTVQAILHSGGDSRKQAVMIFAVAIIGCAIFTVYAATLFYKNKSRETGIFFALGADKKKLKKMIFADVLAVVSSGGAAGIVLSFPVSFGIWGIFRLVIVDTREMVYRFGFRGLFLGIVFSIFVAVCIFLLGIKFVGRTNIIDILHETRKSETVHTVKDWYGAAGLILTAAGLLLGYVFPQFMVQKFYYFLPAVWNAVYGLSVIGIYLLMVYTVTHGKKGNNLQRYYKNIISISMMRFTGRQTVKNMCVMALLVFGASFAFFYVPVIFSGVNENIARNPFDYAYSFEQRINQIKGQEVFELAEEYGISITDYQEMEGIDLIVDGNVWGDKIYGKVEIIYKEKLGYCRFYKAEDIEEAAGRKIFLKPGEYAMLAPSETAEKEIADVSVITDPVTGESRQMTYAGNIPYDGTLAGTGEPVYVLSDEEFEAYEEHLPVENKYTSVLFNTSDWTESYDFGKALKDEIIAGTPEDAAIGNGYDRYAKQEAEAAGEVYFMDDMFPAGKERLELSPDNSQLFAFWKYYPAFKVLQRQDTIKNMAVFLMLFVYIGIICYAAVGIISYTRGITIAVNYGQIFTDLRRLGADKDYIGFCIRSQLKKIFFYPFLTGSALCFAFTFLIVKNNDDLGILSAAEAGALVIDALIIGAAGLYIAGIYALTYYKFKKTIGMDEKV